jgi:hypothetical protein
MRLGRVGEALTLLDGSHAHGQQDGTAVDAQVDLGGDEARLSHHDALHPGGNPANELVSP